MRVGRMDPRFYLVFVSIMCVLSITLFSCGKDSKTGPKDEDGCCLPDTPDNLVAALECAVETQDLEIYEGLLHDEYLFSFVVDVADSLGLPPDAPWWGKTKDVSSTADLFSDGNAEFRVAFIPEEDHWTACQVDRGDMTYTGYCRSYTADLRLHVENPGCEPLTMVGDETYVDVTVVPHHLISGHFAVLQIEEVFKVRGAAPLTETLTWSMVKAMYE
jgi:hypothetical protein